MTYENCLDVCGLHVDFGGRPILNGIRVGISAGDKVLITGASGIGKSMLLNALMGQLPAANVRGSFRIGDRAPVPYADYRRHASFQKRQSAVFQDAVSSLHPYRTIAKQLPSPRSGDLRPVFDMLRLEYDRFMGGNSIYSMECSGGECQRITLVFSIVLERDIIFMDEPLTDIDHIAQRAVSHGLNRILQAPNRTVVLVSHTWDWVPNMFRRLHLDREGLHEMPRDHLGSGEVLGPSSPTAVSRPTVAPLAPPPAASRPTGSAAPVVSLRVRAPMSLGGAGGFTFRPIEEFSVQPGRRVALLGESGSGKTTLLKLLARLGRGALKGADIDLRLFTQGRPRPAAAIDRQTWASRVQYVVQDSGSAFLRQEPILRLLEWIERRTAYQERNFWAHADELGKALRLPMAMEAGWRAISADRLPHELSVGQLRRFALLRAMLLLDSHGPARTEPKLLLLDEISRGLDADTKAEIQSALSAFCEAYNVAVVLISHDIDFVQELCTDFRFMFKGGLLPLNLSSAEVAQIRAGGGLPDVQNPYYVDFLQQTERKRQPLGTASSESGCLFHNNIICPLGESGSCRHIEKFIDEGVLGICG